MNVKIFKYNLTILKLFYNYFNIKKVCSILIKNFICIGGRIKYHRLKNSMTLDDLSKISGISSTYLSQIENNKQTNPSVDTLKKITDSMSLPLMSLFEDEFEKSETVKSSDGKIKAKEEKSAVVEIVRKNGRKTMSYPNADWKIELLSPNLKRKIEFILTVASPGQTSGSGWLIHEGEECGFILQGKLKFIIADEENLLDEGDSIYLKSAVPHKWEVIGNKITKTIWAITPPSF